MAAPSVPDPADLRKDPDRNGEIPALPPALQPSRPAETNVGVVSGKWERGNAMKVRNSLRSLKSKPGSVVTRRRGRPVVINKKNPRWNGRQG